MLLLQSQAQQDLLEILAHLLQDLLAQRVQLAMLLLWQVLQDRQVALEAQAGLDQLAHKEFRAYKAMLAQQVHKEILVMKALQARLERQAQLLAQQVRLVLQALQARKVLMAFHLAFMNI